MSEYQRTLEEVPLIVLLNGRKSYLVQPTSQLSATLTKSGLHDHASRLFLELDEDSLRFEVDIPQRGSLVLTETGYLPALRLLGEGTNLPPILHVKDKNTPDEPVLPTYCSSSVGETEDFFSDTAINGTVVQEKNGGSGDAHPFAICIATFTGKKTYILVWSTYTIGLIKGMVQDKEGIPPDQQRLVFARTALEDHLTLSDYGITEYAKIHMLLKLRGGKPVIYLFPPVPLPSIQVGLTLSPEWSFSALYPVVDVSKSKNGESSVYWQVSAEPSGTLIDQKTETSLSYLFWEAHSEPTSLTFAQNGTLTPTFDPLHPALDASNGIALPFSSFLPYLDKNLAALTLHTAARNEFITYWLPSFNRIHARNQLIAFRFLPQAEYEQAAQLEVEPKPDVITRVFMLFKGVDADEVEGWRKPDEVDWVSEVGVKVDKARDEGLFRVLEWGGMEVVG